MSLGIQGHGDTSLMAPLSDNDLFTPVPAKRHGSRVTEEKKIRFTPFLPSPVYASSSSSSSSSSSYSSRSPATRLGSSPSPRILNVGQPSPTAAKQAKTQAHVVSFSTSTNQGIVLQSPPPPPPPPPLPLPSRATFAAAKEQAVYANENKNPENVLELLDPLIAVLREESIQHEKLTASSPLRPQSASKCVSKNGKLFKQDDFSFMDGGEMHLSTIQKAFIHSPERVRGTLHALVSKDLLNRSQMEHVAAQALRLAHDALWKEEFDIAIEKGLECLRRQSRLLGHDHPSLAIVLSVLGEAYSHSGKFTLAETHFDDALRVLGPSADFNLNANAELRSHIHVQLCHLQRVRSNFKQAVHHARLACEAKKSPSNMMMLGITLSAAEDYPAALRQLEEARAALESVSIESDALQVAATTSTAGLSDNSSPVDTPGAVQPTITLSSKQSISLKEWHESLGAVLCNIGNVHVAQNQLKEALECYSLGRFHLAEAGCLDSLATCLLHTGSVSVTLRDFDLAVRCFEEARTLRVALYGVTHVLTSHCELLLGRVAMERGDFGRAVALFAKARAHRTHALGEGHPETAAAYVLEGHALSAMGRQSDALKCYEFARKSYPTRSMALDMHMASLLLSMGKTQSALSIYFEWLQKSEKDLHKPENKIEVGVLFNEMGNVLRHQGRITESRAAYKRSLSLLESMVGHNHPHCATALSNLGHLELHRHDLKKAQRFYYRALAIRMHHWGDGHLDTAQSFYDLAIAAEHDKNLPLARDFWDKYLAATIKSVGEYHPAVQKARSELVQFKKRSRGVLRS
eukprot:ANDGO_06584.mRNA.1 putative UDP-N-acetylglucosamine--peptide N-acetylglucosaminyltransferase S2.4.1.-